MVDGNFLMQDRRCRAQRKSRTFLKILEETHRTVPKPRTKTARRMEALEDGRKGGEKRCYRRQDEGTRILFKAEHFTATRSAGGNGGSSATPEELIRG